MEKIATGPQAADAIDITASPSENVRRVAEAKGIKVTDVAVVVLDRPDLLGDVPPDGPVLERAFTSFVGAAPVPLRYAMTPGELAAFYVDALRIDCRLTVVELEGWPRRWLDETNVAFEPPSPGLRSLNACAVYAGTVLFEATNVSVGRGTAAPFEWIGAPWLDAARLARLNPPGVDLRPEERAPGRGVRIEVSDRGALRPVALGVSLLAAIRDAHEELTIEPARLDRLAGTDALRRDLERGRTAEEIASSWRPALEAFATRRRRYLRYP
jgi:uncharacterized protein YbbC (DUF1343 family)